MGKYSAVRNLGNCKEGEDPRNAHLILLDHETLPTAACSFILLKFYFQLYNWKHSLLYVFEYTCVSLLKNMFLAFINSFFSCVILVFSYWICSCAELWMTSQSCHLVVFWLIGGGFIWRPGGGWGVCYKGSAGWEYLREAGENTVRKGFSAHKDGH